VALNATLIESWWKPLLTIFGGAITAAIGAIAVLYTIQRGEKQKLQEKREKAYSQRIADIVCIRASCCVE